MTTARIGIMRWQRGGLDRLGIALLALFGCSTDLTVIEAVSASSSTSVDAGSSSDGAGEAGQGSGSGDVGSSSDDDSGTKGESVLTPLPPLDNVVLTTERTIVPTSRPTPSPEESPLDPDTRTRWLAEGLGEFEYGPGDPIVDVTLDGESPPGPGANSNLVGRFVHLADVQLADDESPLRALAFDNPTAPTGAFRPQEEYGCRIFNAAIRTINSIDRVTPIEFVILGGDNVDSAQSNEVAWFRDILGGADAVQCDSGVLDDPIPGPDNDPKDAFAPVGLDVPWRWLSGNHDVLVQGVFPLAGREAAAVGGRAGAGGTRDWSRSGGPMITDATVPADPRRALLEEGALLASVARDGDGHGLDPNRPQTRSSYVADSGDVRLRFVFVDSTSLLGPDTGLIRQADVDTFVRPALDAAEADGVRVVIVSHHASTALGNGAGIGTTPVEDALSGDDWRALLGEYDNVLMHLVGHDHEHRTVWIDPAGGHGYYEVTTAALADFPHQFRIIEVRDEDNGYWSVTLIAVDYATDDDPIAAQGRALGILDFTAGWTPDGRGAAQDRNVRLWIPQ